ncbi:uncharacterized protein EV420DRAFT_1485949 [Desarmillaria tabescens]|uniref:Uncharacterized protein n=1 Tax=Armillaria tabescens TaxID=1929756 RepID=A0AA39JEB4_ARMTA|nr:uncharacterized protein EV420DRAFT_1485949 [Desarmillaria tabescens]KAK0440487.1 hypothetical protein EV420DRAFT_1485949 [Desarmillaria tabescens]
MTLFVPPCSSPAVSLLYLSLLSWVTTPSLDIVELYEQVLGIHCQPIWDSSWMENVREPQIVEWFAHVPMTTKEGTFAYTFFSIVNLYSARLGLTGHHASLHSHRVINIPQNDKGVPELQPGTLCFDNVTWHGSA